MTQRDHMRLVLNILSIVLHTQLVNAMGLKSPGSEWSLPCLRMEITTTLCHDGGRQPDFQTWSFFWEE